MNGAETRWKMTSCSVLLKNNFSKKTLMLPLYFDKLTENLPEIICYWKTWIWILTGQQPCDFGLLCGKNSCHRISIRKNETTYVSVSYTITWTIANAQPIEFYLNLYPSFKNATVAENSKQLVMRYRIELV